MNIIVAHLMGDYVLQSDWMALSKKKSGLTGLLACLIHCAIWTLCVAVGVRKFSPIMLFLLFISHLAIDRSSVVGYVLNKTGWMPSPAMWKVIIVDNALHLFFVSLLLELL